MQRLGVAGFARGEIEVARGIEVLLDAQAFLVEAAEAELRRRQAVLGGAIEPVRRLGEVLRHATAFGKAHRDFVLCGRDRL